MKVAYDPIYSENEVMEWLKENIDTFSVSPSGRTGFNKLQSVVYGTYTMTKKVYFKYEEDAALFALKFT